MVKRGFINAHEFINISINAATFTLLRIRFYLFLLMKTLPLHIASFSNKYAMKTIGVYIAPAKRCCKSLFKTKPFVDIGQKGTNRAFECHCNQQHINTGMWSVFKCLNCQRSHWKRIFFKTQRFPSFSYENGAVWRGPVSPSIFSRTFAIRIFSI